MLIRITLGVWVGKRPGSIGRIFKENETLLYPFMKIWKNTRMIPIAPGSGLKCHPLRDVGIHHFIVLDDLASDKPGRGRIEQYA